MNRVFQLDRIIQDMGLQGLVWIEEDDEGQPWIVPHDDRVLAMLKLDGRWDRLVSTARVLSDTVYMYQGKSADL